MTLLAPLWLGVGLAAALGVLALHFIARMRPPAMTFPTARFVPDLPARAASRAPRPTDKLLLAMRALAALLLGLAFAGPIVTPSRAPLVRVVMLDRSAATADPDSAARLAASLLREGDVLVSFDTTTAARVWEDGAAIPESRQAPGDLAAALLTGTREARDAAPRADSVEMILIAPLVRASWSEAVLPLRAEWPGALRVERVAAASGDSLVPRVRIDGEPDDPIRATFALLGRPSDAAALVRVLRSTAPAADDSAWARDTGGVLVVWPAATDAGDDGEPSGGVVANGAIAVGPWSRLTIAEGRVIARWADGSAAATEVLAGRGCVRSVGVGIPPAGDAALSAGAQRIAAALTGPCGAVGNSALVPDSLVRRLAGSGGAVPGRRLVRAGASTAPATPWLIAAALALLVGEWLLRDRRRVS